MSEQKENIVSETTAEQPETKNDVETKQEPNQEFTTDSENNEEESILSNCRVLTIAKNASFFYEIKSYLNESHILTLDHSLSDVAGKNFLEKNQKINRFFHFIIFDLDGHSPSQFDLFYNYFKEKKYLLPILIIEASKAKELLTKEYKLTKKINRVTKGKELVKSLEMLYHETYPNGVKNISIQDETNYKIINFDNTLDEASYYEFKNIAAKITPYNQIHNILNLEKLIEAPKAGLLRLFTKILSDWKAQNINYSTVITNSAFIIELKEKGLNSVFRIAPSVDEARKETIPKTPASKPGKYATIDVKMVNPFIIATINTFNESLSLSLKPGQTGMKQKFDCLNAEFATIINVNSSGFNGCISQIFTRDVFLKYFSAVKEKASLSNPKEIMDFTNDLLIKIFGKATLELEKHDYKFSSITPKIVQGHENIKKEIPDSMSISIVLESSIGKFDLLITARTQ